MSPQARQAKVLRIGVIQDGKLVQERLAKSGDPVTVGSGARNTFVFPGLALAEFTLFDWRDDRYHLNFTTELRGKVSSGGAMFALEKARSDPTVAFADDVWSLPLTEQDRGKVRMGDITVLFQFVPPPPIQAAAPLESMDFRPRLIQDDDPVFLGFLAIWSAAALVFSVWVFNAETPEISMEELPDRFTTIKIVKPAEETPETPKDDALESDDAKTKAKAKEDEPEPEPTEKAKPKDKVDKARDMEKKKDALRQQSALFKELQARMIGTTGEASAGTVLLANADGNFGDVTGKLDDAAKSGQAMGDGSRMRAGDGVPGGTGDRNIGDITGGTDGGTTDLGSAPKVELKGSVATGDIEFDGDVSGLAKVIRKYRGQLRYCYEQSLKSNPSLHGKVVLGWYVEGESANDIFVAENTTGDSKFADCLKSKVKRWKFSGVDDGNARQPFIFQPQQ
jgi:hypothetical protein